MASLSQHPSRIGSDIRTRLRAGDLPPSEIVELITRDLEGRWQRGERVLIETYLALLPNPLDADAHMDLLYAEVLARESAGDHPTPAEYVFRFPALTERIHAQFLLHRALLDDGVSAEPAPVVAQVAVAKFAHAVPGYEILGELGSGGMGVVYKARHLQLQRTVAIKVLRADSWDRDAEARLRREAEALARVQHPHIVQIYEVGLADAEPYLALEYVGGGTLADRFRAGPMKSGEVAAIVRMVALAVHAAHEQGLVHRDLKPANILLPTPSTTTGASDSGPSSRSGVVPEPPVKVTDFGLVKRLDQHDLSRTGELLGTPSYMAPEQAAGRKDIGPAADVYSLGAILYEGVSGRPPFQGESVLPLLAQVADAEPIPPSRLCRGLSADLEAVVLKCLEKEPAKRYASAADLAEDLRRFLAGEPTQARPLTALGRAVKLVRRHPVPAALLALIVVSVLGGLGGILWQWREAVEARGNLETALDAEAEQRRQAVEARGSLQTALDAEAKQRREAEQHLYRSRIAQAALLWEGRQTAQARELLATCRPRAGDDDPRGWEWHYLNRLFHAEIRTLHVPAPVNGLALCPSVPDNGEELAVALGRGEPSTTTAAGFLSVKDPSGVFRAGPAVDDALAVAVRPQPNGETLAVWASSGRTLIVGDCATGKRLNAVPLAENAGPVCLTPEGNVLVGGGAKSLREVNPLTGAVIADHPVAIAYSDALAIHPSGQFVAVGNTPSGRLLIYERPGYRQVKELTSSGTGLQAVSFSPDGRRIAAAYQSGNIRVWEAGNWRELRLLQDGPEPVRTLAFHPSGDLLAAGGADHIVRLWDVKAGQLAARYRGHDAEITALAFGPKGAWLASGSRDRTVRIWDPRRDPRGWVLHWNQAKNDILYDQPPAGLNVQTMKHGIKFQTWLEADGRPLVSTTLVQDGASGSWIQQRALLKGGRVAVVSKTDARTLTILAADGRMRLLPAKAGPIQAVAADSGGNWLAWAAPTKDGVIIRSWNATAEAEGESIHLKAPAVRSLSISPKGDWVLAVASEFDAKAGTVLWSIDCTGKQLPCELLREPQFGGAAFRADGRELAVSVGNAVKVFSVGRWELGQTSGLADAVALAYSPNGRRLAAINDEGVVTLIDPATGKALFQLHSMCPLRPKHLPHQPSIAFSPDGAWLVSANWDRTFNLWDGSFDELPAPPRIKN